MKCNTAKHLRDAKQRLGRDFAAKERRRALARLRAGQTVHRVEEETLGDRPVVTLVWSDGPAECLPVKPTYVHFAPAAQSTVEPGAHVHWEASGPVGATRAPVLVRRAESSGRPRASATRSSARSGDSGDDGAGGSSDPERPGPRICACGCGRDVDHLRVDAKYFETACRVAAQRARDRANPERVAERSALRQRAEKQFEASGSGPCPGPNGAVGKCGATLVSRDPEGGLWCVLCGTPRGPLTSPNGFREFDDLMRANGTFVGQSHTKLEWEWKTCPKRSQAARPRQDAPEVHRRVGHRGEVT
jgi:hypothetical protein